MTLNGVIVDFIAVGGAVILTGLGMGLVLLLTEDRRGRIFVQEIPAKFRAIVATPEHPASDWVRPMHAAAPSALRAARHLAGLGHLLRPKGISEGRAAKLARQVYRRALVARAFRPVPGAGLSTPFTGYNSHLPTRQTTLKVDSPAPKTGPPRDQPAPVLVAALPAAAGSVAPPEPPPLPVTDVPGPEVGTADRAHGDPVTVAGDPAAAGSAAIDVLPPLPPEIPAPDCDYLPAAPFADWLRDSFVGAIPAVK